MKKNIRNSKLIGIQDDFLQITHAQLKDIQQPDNLTEYRQGYIIKNRTEVVKPTTGLLIEKYPLIKNRLRISYARHDPSSALYLKIRVECKACKDVGYSINLKVKPLK